MTRKHRRHSTAKKREIVEAYLNGGALHALSKQHDVCRNLIRVWIEKYERGEYDDDAVEADLLPEYEARIAALERLAGKQALEQFIRKAEMVAETHVLDEYQRQISGANEGRNLVVRDRRHEMKAITNL